MLLLYIECVPLCELVLLYDCFLNSMWILILKKSVSIDLIFKDWTVLGKAKVAENMEKKDYFIMWQWVSYRILNTSKLRHSGDYAITKVNLITDNKSVLDSSPDKGSIKTDTAHNVRHFFFLSFWALKCFARKKIIVTIKLTKIESLCFTHWCHCILLKLEMKLTWLLYVVRKAYQPA